MIPLCELSGAPSHVIHFKAETKRITGGTGNGAHDLNSARHCLDESDAHSIATRISDGAGQ